MTKSAKSRLIKNWEKLNQENIELRKLIEYRKERLNNPISRNLTSLSSLVRLMKKDKKQWEKLTKLADKIHGFTS